MSSPKPRPRVRRSLISLESALLLYLFVLLLLILFVFDTQLGGQTREVVPFPGILVPVSPPPVSRLTADLAEDSDLPLMRAAGVVRAVGVVYPDDLVVGHDLVPVPTYEESQLAAGL
jgi:hypothetical protein